MNEKRWEILHKLRVPDAESLITVLLANRGIETKKEKEEFFEPTPPEKLGIKALGISNKEINKAIKRVKKALKTKEKVIVYGDYDADGICGTAILWECLYALGLNVLPHIPERFTEGYGLNAESVQKLKIKNEKLKIIITADNGIVANAGVEKAKELGIDVIITDHHLPCLDRRGKPVKPEACATIHTTKISGSAVAWVFAREILRQLHTTSYKLPPSLELVAIGTISDQLSLIGPNRSFAKYGLAALNKTKRPGLLALFEEAGIKAGLIGPYEVGFMIAPRINAMGRLTNAIDSLRLLCTKDKTKARDLAGVLGRTNAERQRIVDEVVLHARNQLGSVRREGIIVLAHESYHEGVIGLAAAKLVEEFYHPAIVLSRKKNISKASARSISGFNIIEAIRKLEGLYVEGGGHPMAAGFSIETSKIEIFAKKINEVARPLLTEEILTKRLKIDLELNFNQINMRLFEVVQSFEPTGLGNPPPTFATRGASVVDARVIGRDGKHLKLRLRQDSVELGAIAFGSGAIFPELTPDKEIDIAYNLLVDEWNGNKRLELKIKDIRIAE